MQHVVAKTLTQCHKREITGLCVQQRDTKQQEGRGRSRQNRILDTRFQRALLTVRVTNQAEQRQRDQLNTEEQRRQMVGVCQQNTAQ
ncbi:hypothetical protein D3C80_1616900 [compost metagenome]